MLFLQLQSQRVSAFSAYSASAFGTQADAIASLTSWAAHNSDPRTSVVPSRPARAPLHSVEIDPPARIEANALALEQLALPLIVTGRGAELALRIHDALPGDACARGQRVQRVADKARLAGDAGDARDLPVGRDAASGNARHDRVDSGMQTVGLHASSQWLDAGLDSCAVDSCSRRVFGLDSRQRQGRIQSAERAVPTRSTTIEAKLHSA